ncbi:MAG: exodeoxyribonuclease VII large subunit [Candidatus Fermentibacteraceae bacterium]|nr:exodeoxyribonuclease VII large subunit [Candidatus Fermentibacteraceae bacterium]
MGELLSTVFPQPVWVRGEIAEVSGTNTRGHSYFRLCEPSPDGMGQPLAVIDCALFAGSRPDIVRSFAREGQVFQLKEGMTVRVRGTVTIWDRGGRYQLIVDDIDPSWSMGDQAMKLRRLVDRLRGEGVLQANGQLDMSPAPLRIGLVTSRESAASQDFLQGLKDSGYPFRVYAAWASMQGENTAGSVIGAFNRLLTVPDLDAVVLTRGGGSATDLAWFNDEHIAGVISQVPWPVISGIGHETDSTLPDFVSHTSVKTPTQCAEFLVNRVADFLANIDSLAVVLHRSASRRLAGIREGLSSLASVISRTGVMAFRMERHRLGALQDLLERSVKGAVKGAVSDLSDISAAFRRVLETGTVRRYARELHGLRRNLSVSARQRLALALSRLEGLRAAVSGNDPIRLYGRGWATVRNSDGELLRSIEDTSLKEMIEVTLRDGRLHARTERIVPEGSELEHD